MRRFCTVARFCRALLTGLRRVRWLASGWFENQSLRQLVGDHPPPLNLIQDRFVASRSLLRLRYRGSQHFIEENRHLAKLGY